MIAAQTGADGSGQLRSKACVEVGLERQLDERVPVEVYRDRLAAGRVDPRHDRPGGELIRELGEVSARVPGDAPADALAQVGEPVRQCAKRARQEGIGPVRRDHGIEHETRDVRRVGERVSERLLGPVRGTENRHLVHSEPAADRVHVVRVVERGVQGASSSEPSSAGPDHGRGLLRAGVLDREEPRAGNPARAAGPAIVVGDERVSGEERLPVGAVALEIERLGGRLSRAAGHDEHHPVGARPLSEQLLDVQMHGSAPLPRRIERDGERSAEHARGRATRRERQRLADPGRATPRHDCERRQHDHPEPAFHCIDSTNRIDSRTSGGPASLEPDPDRADTCRAARCSE